VETRGELIGALMVGLDDEVFAITSAGGVIRTTAAEIKQSGRQTMGVRLVNLASGQTLVAIARNAEEPVNGAADDGAEEAADAESDVDVVAEGSVDVGEAGSADNVDDGSDESAQS
jgi:DNA gyrase subunit A